MRMARDFTHASHASPHRDRERKRRTRSNLALDPDPPPMQLDKPPGEGESEACPFGLLLRRPHLPKLLEYRLQVLWSDSHARVAHRHLHVPAHGRGPDTDPP